MAALRERSQASPRGFSPVTMRPFPPTLRARLSTRSSSSRPRHRGHARAHAVWSPLQDLRPAGQHQEDLQPRGPHRRHQQAPRHKEDLQNGALRHAGYREGCLHPQEGYMESYTVKIAIKGLERFREVKYDLIIIDTSGRHKQEAALFEEMRQVAESTVCTLS